MASRCTYLHSNQITNYRQNFLFLNTVGSVWAEYLVNIRTEWYTKYAYLAILYILFRITSMKLTFQNCGNFIFLTVKIFTNIFMFTSVNSMSLREKASWLLLGKIRLKNIHFLILSFLRINIISFISCTFLNHWKHVLYTYREAFSFKYFIISKLVYLYDLHFPDE